MESLLKLQNLRQLDINENPVTTEKGEDFKKEVMIKLALSNPKLRRLNDEELTADDVRDALAEKEERIRAEEQARKEAEERAANGEGVEKQEEEQE